MNKVKVVHMTSVHPITDVRVFQKQCKSIASSGYDLTFIIPNLDVDNYEGIKIASFKHKYKNRFHRMISTVNKVYKKALELDADIYHFHDPELIRIGKKLIKKGKKVIYDVHEDVPKQILGKTYIPSFLKKTISKLIERFELKSAAKMSVIICATPHIQDRFLKVNPKSFNINNYPILDELLNDFPYEEKKGNYITYIGVISLNRGVKELIESLSLSNSRLILGGNFATTQQEGDFKKMTNWAAVEFRGFMKRDQVKKAFQEAKAGMVTLRPLISFQDSLPVKMFEYMAAGLPVIASDFKLWKDIIEKNNCGLCVDPLNPDEIAKAIQFILDNPEKAKEMGENGKRMVISEFNWENEKRKLLAIYKDLSDDLNPQ